jgi:Protein of unknown function (DUF3105)
MAKKRRRPRNRPQQRTATRTQAPRAAPRKDPEGSAHPPQAPKGPPATERARSARAERKDIARQERERARKAAARRIAIRRALTIGAVVTVLGVGAYLIFNVSSPGTVSAQALEVGAAAGCGDVLSPAADAPGGNHLESGESAGYTEHPATSGAHDPAPLPPEPAVHTDPIREENAVHNLEHGYVILYYRAEGPQALGEDVVDRLAQVAERDDKVLLAPYPDLEEGTSFAMTAWNKLWECPADVSPDDAATMANSFIEAYRGTSNAPEPNAA